MRRFYFDLRHGDSLSVDDEGTELPDIETAQKEATHSLATLARDAIQGKAATARGCTMAIEVRDDVGAVLQARFSFEVRHQRQSA